LPSFKLLLVAVLLLSACGSEQPATPVEREKVLPLVEVAVVATGENAVRFERNGELKVRHAVKIVNQQQGVVAEVRVDEGDHVKRGELLVALDDPVMKAELDRARIRLKQAEADLARLRKLGGKRLVAGQTLSDARGKRDLARADAALLQVKVDHLKVLAPFDGVVSERLIQPGDVAERYTHLLTLIDPSSLITEFTVPESVRMRLNPGDPVSIRVDSAGSESFTGKISRLSPGIDPRTRLSRVEVELAPVPASALPGQFARVTLGQDIPVGLTIPVAALRRDREGEFVYVVDSHDIVRRQAVGVGLRLHDRVEILTGLNKGDRVVVAGFLGLKPGKKVRVRASAAAAAEAN